MEATVRESPGSAALETDSVPVADGDELVEDEDLLVEEISIDGMCGVY